MEIEWFRYATSVYGQETILGANWDLIWWFGGAGLAYILVDLLCRPFLGKKPAKAGSHDGARVRRHEGIDRAYHWLMAIAILVLLFTSFAPILDWKFEWTTPHWIAGVTLSILVVFHIIRALFFQDRMIMIVTPTDVKAALHNARAALSKGAMEPLKPGKYVLLQKLYHWAIAGLVFVLMGTGLLMWRKIDTPFWRRDPYMLDEETWGYVYAAHDFCAMSVLAIVAIHIYFAARPDKWWQNRSMFTGDISRADYLARHDVQRWKAEDV